MKLLCIIGVLCFLACDVNGHGYLLEPPGRASAWRAGFPTPHNYDDNALFCGGFAVGFVLIMYLIVVVVVVFIYVVIILI